MANAGSSAVLTHVRTLFGAGALGGASDKQLLERFQRRGGPDAEAAFAALVDRHGPMVLGVCRRALRDPNDAADAFQATFLVLVRKAGSVRVEDSLSRWLYGVSCRVVARARVVAARRAVREGSGPGPEPARTEPEDSDRRELLAALDEEIARLPEPFRAAIVLCDLGGLTHETAAKQLGCPVGTIESRLSRGRKRLRERLTRRGLAPVVMVPADLACSMIPRSLSIATVDAAARNAALSTAVSNLIQGVISDMIWTKLKILAMGLGAITIAGGLGIAATRHLKAGEEPPNPVARPAPAPDKAATAAPLQPPVRVRPGDNFLIEVLESLPGRPITGERMVRPDGTISLGFYGDLMVVGLDRHEIKVKVIEHLRKYLTDAQLGLVRKDPKSGELVEVVPADSGHVFVDDSEIENARLRARVSGILPGIDFVHDSDIENVRPAAPSVIERRTLVKPGDLVLIEVLQAAQGRPITGHRRVRPDGTLSLGFYGDIQVAGLDRREIKAKVIERLRPYASDGQLGLIRKDPKTGQKIRVDPADSDCVFVDESVNLYAEGVRNRRDGGTPERLKAIESKLDQLIRAVERLGGRGMR